MSSNEVHRRGFSEESVNNRREKWKSQLFARVKKKRSELAMTKRLSGSVSL